jgi:lipopolysaccharide/colanic/teichoic acid biosynthesis glycosyltransferase
MTKQNKTETKNRNNRMERFVKRSTDILVSVPCLVLFSPLFVIISLAIKWEDGLPIIYKQERIGLHGKPFNIYKFRSMKADAEKDGPNLLEIEGDTRLTRVGKFIRAHHFDELPQLWNILKGDMSLVGPRPERKYYIDQIMEHDPRYTYLYQIRPGATSYATLYNGYTDTMPKMLRRLELDLFYLEHRSWWFDTKILVKTFINIAFGKKF